ncbi:MAG: hypothetical protein Q7S18_02560 [bacterium]|nr:hypothetical protein [bacterium]
MINEILNGHEEPNGVKHGVWEFDDSAETDRWAEKVTNGWSYNAGIKRWQKWESYAFYYERFIPIFRTILEYTISREAYTSCWKTADILVLISPICTCCDHGENMLNAVNKVRKEGFQRKLIAMVKNVTELNKNTTKLLCDAGAALVGEENYMQIIKDQIFAT